MFSKPSGTFRFISEKSFSAKSLSSSSMPQDCETVTQAQALKCFITSGSSYTFFTKVVFPIPPIPVTEITLRPGQALINHPISRFLCLSIPTRSVLSRRRASPRWSCLVLPAWEHVLCCISLTSETWEFCYRETYTLPLLMSICSLRNTATDIHTGHNTDTYAPIMVW